VQRPDDCSFTVIELRLDPAMRGEGKTSLTGKVSIDAAANTIALEDVRPLHADLQLQNAADLRLFSHHLFATNHLRTVH
jgi:hypothetical protein